MGQMLFLMPNEIKAPKMTTLTNKLYFVIYLEPNNIKLLDASLEVGEIVMDTCHTATSLIGRS